MKANCLCNSVEFSFKSVPQEVHACHCAMCRQWGGGPFFSVSCGGDMEIKGEKNISVFDSSQWAERAFCSRCGTHLYYKLKGKDRFAIPVGLFAKEEHFVLEEQIFIDKKPAYYELANETRNMTEAEAFEKYT